MKSLKPILSFMALIACLTCACQRDDYIQVRDYPRIDLNEKITQDAQGITFEAFIISQAGEIDDKGFVWDEGTGASVTNGSLVSLGPGYGSGTFSASINHGLEEGLEYEVRAYLVSGGRTIYSKRGLFVSTISGR